MPTPLLRGVRGATISIPRVNEKRKWLGGVVTGPTPIHNVSIENVDILPLLSFMRALSALSCANKESFFSTSDSTVPCSCWMVEMVTYGCNDHHIKITAAEMS